MRKHIPNFITLLNLSCGFIACIYALNARADMAAYFIAFGAMFDLLDGMIARALGVSSPIGKQLDSLADMVSFGVAPALIARELILAGQQLHSGNIVVSGWELLLAYVPVVLVCCSALRLAKFNIDESQTSDFKGLPTPANALFWLSIPLSLDIGHHAVGILKFIQEPLVLSILCILLGALMVSRINLFSLKIDTSDKGRIVWQAVLLVTAILGLVLYRFAALPMVIVLYLLLALIRNSITRHEIQS